MSSPPRFAFPLWLIGPVLALGFLIWTNVARVQRVGYVTGIAEWSVDEPAANAASPTGYADNQRRLIVPEHNNESYQWIAQTQRMLTTGEWRIRHNDADNAPFGRDTHLPSPYRWWLGFVAWLVHLFTGRPLTLAAEHAALFADPLLHALLLVATVIFVARRFGGFSAALVSLGLALLFPFAAGFLAGAPDHHGLAAACALWSVLPLLAGFRITQDAGSETRARRNFFLAGAIGGFGLWISTATQAPLLGGIALGALLSAWFTRGAAATTPPPWRSWALAGGVTSLMGYMAEYFPGHLALQLEVNHPLYAMAWLGGGELLHRGVVWIRHGKPQWRSGDFAVVALALAALAAVPVMIARSGGHGFLIEDPLATRLSYLGGTVAKTIADWIARDGLTGGVAATLFPLILLAAALTLIMRGARASTDRAALALGLGPVAVALGFACLQLRWCNILDATLLALLAAVSATASTRLARVLWCGGIAVILLPGLVQLLPASSAEARHALSETDVESIVERDLAHWLAKRTGGNVALVLASPDLTTTMNFHGGLRGLGTLDWENKDGLAAAVRIASATSPAEALALIQQRGVTHLVLPSWDPFLEEYARLGSSMVDRSFVAALKRWAPFFWLRPVAYHLPEIAGFEAQSVVVFEVIEEQDESVALSVMAEYFVETNRPEQAAAMQKKLLRFPGDLGAKIALAHIEAGRGDAAGFGEALNSIIATVGAGGDRSLAWERRVSLAAVLAQGKRPDLAREQVRRCLAEANDARVRTLSSGSLFRLLLLGKKFGLEISDQRLRELTLSLLPPASRQRL